MQKISKALLLTQKRFDESPRFCLEAGEELIGVLVLAHVDGLAVIVLERPPEPRRPVKLQVAQRQVGKHGLRCD